MFKKKFGFILLSIGLSTMLLTGCGGKKDSSKTTDDGKKVVTIWRGDGTDQEEAFYEKQIEEFNKANNKIKIESEVFPYNDFSKTVRAAISTDTLPDILFVDGTDVANLAFSKGLSPLDEYLNKDIISGISTSALSKYNNEIYGVAQQEGGLGLWANKKHLESAGVRIPTYEQPWTKDEFTDALKKLKAVDGVEYPFDIKVNNGPGYVAYAWQPIVKSFGGDWYNQDTIKASGMLNSEKTIEAMTYMQQLTKDGYINPTQSSDTELKEGRSSLELTGHWAYGDNKKALGDDLTLIPLPDFGNKSQTGVGGITFGITPKAVENGVADEAVKFIESTLSEKYQKEINEVNGALPVNIEVLNSVETFKEGQDLELYAKQIEGGNFAVRPPSPAYPTYQEEIGTAAFNILTGADAKEQLDVAAKKIDDVIEANKY